MLTHGRRECVDAACGHGVVEAKFAPCHVEGVFISVDVAIVEVAPFVQKHGELERGPAVRFVDEDLAALKLGFVAIGDVHDAPDTAVGGEASVVGPEDCAFLGVFGFVEEVGGVADGDVIGIEKEDFAEGAVEQGEGFTFPAGESADGVLFAHFRGIDGGDAVGREDVAHGGCHFVRAEVPEFDG